MVGTGTGGPSRSYGSEDLPVPALNGEEETVCEECPEMVNHNLVPAKRYVVVIDGAGEYDSDFDVLVLDAPTPEAAIDRVVNDMGYGNDRDGVAYVAEFANVEKFRINPSNTKVITRTTFEEIVESTPPALREYLDVDGGHAETARAAREQRVADEVAAADRSREILTTPVDDVSEVGAKIRRSRAS